jgi:hypothetical protein
MKRFAHRLHFLGPGFRHDDDNRLIESRTPALSASGDDNDNDDGLVDDEENFIDYEEPPREHNLPHAGSSSLERYLQRPGWDCVENSASQP